MTRPPGKEFLQLYDKYKALLTCGRLVSDNSASSNRKLWNKRLRLKADWNRNLKRVRDTQVCRFLTKTEREPRPTSRDFLSSLHEMHHILLTPCHEYWKVMILYRVKTKQHDKIHRGGQCRTVTTHLVFLYLDGDCGRWNQEKRYQRTRGSVMERSADRTEIPITRRKKKKTITRE